MSEQILLIDDDQLMLKVLEKVLTKAGFSVTCAKDGHEAIQKARETLFDLVISDVKMAGMDGLETLAEMNRIAPDSKKIIITGYANQDAPIKAIKLGVDDYFFKPFDAREFVRSVQASMEKYRISRERDQALQDIREAYLTAIKSLALAIEKRSPYKDGHSARVAAGALRIAKKMGFSRKRLDELELACHLHDLGEVEIEREILDKPDVLTADEWSQVREHPVSIRNTLGALTDLSSVLTTIRHHHERYDGTGYPDRLTGDKIPLPSRILHVAEAFDALTSPRPHRESREPQEALSVLSEEAGTQFDPEVIEAFVSSFGEEEDLAQESVQDLLSDLTRKSSRGLLHLARTCFSVGDLETAKKAYQEILDARERTDDPDTLFSAAHDLSGVFWISGNVTRAVELAASALDIARKNQLVLQEAKAVASLGLFNHTLGKPAQAEELLFQAMGTVRKCQDVFEEAGIHLYLAYIYLGQEGKTAKVREHLESVLEISRRTSLGELYLRERKVLVPLLAFAFRESFHTDSLGSLVSSLDKESLRALLTLMGNETHPARAALAQTLREVGGDAASFALSSLAEDGNEDVRKSAAEALLFRAGAETGERIQIRILGPFQLKRRDGPVTEEQWRMKKAKGLLAYLVTYRDRQISEETLMDLFWPNLTPDRARHNLHNTVYSLRRVLEPELREGSVSLFIVHKKSFYRFNPESPYWLDTEEFEIHAASADRLILQGKRAEAILEYQEAERLYRGDFMEDDLDAEWAGVARDQLRGKYLDILWRLADYFSEQKKHEVSKNLCRKILQADDCYEKAYLILMKNFWLEGRKDEAVKHYHLCADILKRELGVSVSEEVMALYLKIIG